MPTPMEEPKRRKGARRPKQAELAAEETPNTGPVGGIKPPKAQTEPLTALVVYPEGSYQVMCGIVVPVCQGLAYVKGANNVDYDEDRKLYDISRAKADIEKRGGIVIPFDVDGRGRSYVKRIKNHGGWIYRWQRVYSGSARIDTDDKVFAEWLRGLVERGVLPDPPAYCIEALLGQLRTRRAALIQAGKEKYQPKLDQLERDIRAAEEELERVQELVESEVEEAVPGEVNPDDEG